MAVDTTWIIGKTEATAEHGMVTSMHPLASKAGLRMLEAGGNAVDAAVATAFAIGVVEPFMSGVGGVAAMVYHNTASGKTVIVDGSSVAPADARPDMFELAPAGELGGIYGWRGTVGDASNTGYRAPIVPGMPGGMLYALERHGSGRLSRQQVLAPAIELAGNGFPIDTYVAQTAAFAQQRLRKFPESLRTFFKPDGTPFTPASLSKTADIFRQPELARTIEMLAERGPDAMYHGEIGHKIADDMQANGGHISRDDFAAFRPRQHDVPLEIDYRGYTLRGIPELSGCATAYEALNILERFDLRALGAGSAALHLIAEACRLAFRDRFGHLGDPAMVEIPLEGLLSKSYAASRAAEISRTRANPAATAGDPWAHQARQPAWMSAGSAAAGDGCTTHLCVIDADRNMVSLTTTLGELYGSGVVARGTGVCLNNGMTWFDPEPGRINSIAPRKRILWAPTPTLVLKDGQPRMAIGAPGGRRIISAIVQCLVNVLDFDMGPQDAVAAPRVHSEGPITMAGTRFGRAVLDELAALGHDLQVVEDDSAAFSFARPNAILIDPASGHLRGGVNQFVPAYGAGY